MNDEQTERKKKGSGQINFNTIVSFVVLGAVMWVKTSIETTNDKMSKISERMVALETASGSRIEQANRIEAQLRDLQTQFNAMSLDWARIKGVGRP